MLHDGIQLVFFGATTDQVGRELVRLLYKYNYTVWMEESSGRTWPNSAVLGLKLGQTGAQLQPTWGPTRHIVGTLGASWG